MIPVAWCVWRGEIHGLLHSSIPPYETEPSGSSKRRTSGSSILIPIPAGTVTGLPSTNTSRCACTWLVKNSFGAGFRRAGAVRSIGSDGAGHSKAAAWADGDAAPPPLGDAGAGDRAGAEPH